MMDAKSECENELNRKADLSLRVTERITSINKDLVPVTTIIRLSNNPVIDHHLFDSMTPEDVLKLAVKLVIQVNEVKVLLKDARTIVEDIDITSQSDLSPQISSQISDLQSKVDDFVNNKPEPLDYSKIAKAVTKTLPKVSTKPSPPPAPVNMEQFVKVSNERIEETQKKNNLMVYGLFAAEAEDSSAEDLLKRMFQGCGVENLNQMGEHLHNAEYVKIDLENNRTVIRAVMRSPHIVEQALKLSKELKSSSDYSYVYLSKDRTKSEQERHRKLVLDLKKKIAGDRDTRWAIERGVVVDKGPFFT